MSTQPHVYVIGGAGAAGIDGLAGELGLVGPSGQASTITKSWLKKTCHAATSGQQGNPGGTGQNAGNGQPGQKPPELVIRALTYRGQVNLTSQGGTGGAGGTGGLGGKGGTGGIGGTTSGSACDDATLPVGGDGGTGGAGGHGGTGGAGGQGGNIYTYFPNGATQPSSLSLNCPGGFGGNGGKGGEGGDGGEGGEGGIREGTDQSGAAGASGEIGDVGQEAGGGPSAPNGSPTFGPTDIEAYDVLLASNQVPRDHQYEDLNGATTLDVAAKDGIVPYMMNVTDIDQLKAVIGVPDGEFDPVPMPAVAARLLSPTTGSRGSGSDADALHGAARSYILGLSKTKQVVKAALDAALGGQTVAVFAIENVVVPTAGLQIVNTGPDIKFVLLMAKSIAYQPAGSIAPAPLFTLTINADTFDTTGA